MNDDRTVLVDDVLYTDAETRAMLKVDRRTLAAWRATGKIRALHLSKRCLRYRGAEIRRFLDHAGLAVRVPQ